MAAAWSGVRPANDREGSALIWAGLRAPTTEGRKADTSEATRLCSICGVIELTWLGRNAEGRAGSLTGVTAGTLACAITAVCVAVAEGEADAVGVGVDAAPPEELSLATGGRTLNSGAE